MPTIDQLDPAVVAADDDALLVSQGGKARRVTRGQLIAGTQTQVTLTPGLLGRTTPGVGGLERVAVGGGLRLADGVLSSPPPFAIAALPAASLATAADMVPVSQAGQDRAIGLNALLGLPGIDISAQIVKATLGVARKARDWVDDAITVETFGAIGDGVTDDTAAFTLAMMSGRPVRLGPKTYRVDGQWSVSIPTVMVGTAGATVLHRATQAGGAWISISAGPFVANGVVFDAGGLSGDSWGVLVEPTCTQTTFESCSFINASGRTLGSGLTIQARDGLSGSESSHAIRACSFHNNAVHGLWVQAACGAVVDHCSAWQNGAFGICLDYNDPQFQQVVQNSTITGCKTWGNQRGISVGNYNETNLEPPRWGTLNPDARDILVADNVCYGNSAYGIAVAGERVQVNHNQVTISHAFPNASGILCNASRSIVCDNTVCGSGQFGIDAGGCVECEIAENLVQDCNVGINAGGGRSVRIAGNRLCSNDRAITAFQVETDGNGGNFGIACRGLFIERNFIRLRDHSSSSGGVFLFDGPQDVFISNNSFLPGIGASPAQALSAQTDSVSVSGNLWSESASFVAVSTGQVAASIQFPEILDAAVIASTLSDVGSILGQRQAALTGQITFIRVNNGGSGYQRATVLITGAGSGAQAMAYLRDGVVIGVAVSSGGAGYDANVAVAITGDGSGATAAAFVGLPVPEGRRLILRCDVAVRFKADGSDPAQENWTGRDISIPAGSEIVWQGVAGRWRAVAFNAVDYVRPAGDGSVSVSSVQGDVSFRPGAGGQVRVCSDSEGVGFVSCLGRGSPEGMIAAPPGSDYRNLDGGVGTTLWLKRSGTDKSGWAAIA